MIFSFNQICLVSIIITLLVGQFFIGYIKSKESISTLILGHTITIVGLFMLYLVYDVVFYTNYGNIIPYFIPTCVITTGLFLSIIGYVKSSSK